MAVPSTPDPIDFSLIKRSLRFVLILIGGSFGLLSAFLTYQDLKIGSWPKVSAVIERSKIVSLENRLGWKIHKLKTTYRYVFNKVAYRGDNHHKRDIKFEDHTSALALAAKFSQGKQVFAYVNPERPSEAYLTFSIGSLAKYSGVFAVSLLIGATAVRLIPKRLPET